MPQSTIDSFLTKRDKQFYNLVNIKNQNGRNSAKSCGQLGKPYRDGGDSVMEIVE